VGVGKEEVHKKERGGMEEVERYQEKRRSREKIVLGARSLACRIEA
jgi:hypothetical protein